MNLNESEKDLSTVPNDFSRFQTTSNDSSRSQTTPNDSARSQTTPNESNRFQTIRTDPSDSYFLTNCFVCRAVAKPDQVICFSNYLS